jgi:GDP-L-fucose synthase
MELNAKIYVAGHRGMVGSAIVRHLRAAGYENVVTRTRQELDLLDQAAVRAFYAAERPDYVIIAAAKVGGIMANKEHQADFLYENLQIQNNIIWGAHELKVKKLMFLGSSCIYPRAAAQPMKEEYFLTGPFEPTNEGYAVAKSAGMKLCEKLHEQYGDRYITCMPTNLYGENDNFDLQSSHVFPALIRRFHEAKLSGAPSVTMWGTGAARREFLYVGDLAEAVVHLMNRYDGRQFLNVGTGEDISIAELAAKIKTLVGYEGEIIYDTSKPDGMPRKLLDVSRIHEAGWHHRTSLDEGLRIAYDWFRSNAATARK